MKCFLVVNQLNDPFYIDYDTGFSKFIIHKCKENGLLEKNVEISELDANLVMQLFSPMVLSQWLLIDQIKEPCSSITCPNGFRFVFKHVDDLLFIAINGDGSESEEFLHRKIQVFIRLMRFLFGPVSEEIGHSKLQSKKAKWAFLRSLIGTWSEMIQSEQTFLVEAVEKLNVNQMVSEKCMEILEKSVRQIQAVHDYPIQHAVLLVNSRLLALYSKRIAHELRAKDILSLMILSKTLYPNTERKTSSRPAGSHSNAEDNSDGAEDEYHSASTTPRSGSRPRTPLLKQEDKGHKVQVIKEENPKPKPEETDSQVAADSDTQLKTSKADDSSDHESINNKSLSPNKDMTLLQMYKEKYPDPDDERGRDVHTNHYLTSPTRQIVHAEIHKSDGESSDQGTSTVVNDNDSSRCNSALEEEEDDTKLYREEVEDFIDIMTTAHEVKNYDTSGVNVGWATETEINVSGKSTAVHQGSQFLAEDSTDDQSLDNKTMETLVPEMIEHDVFSVASRSSSVLSNQIQNYPDLLPCGHGITFDMTSNESPEPHQTDSRRIAPRTSPSPQPTDPTDSKRKRAESSKSKRSSDDPNQTYLPQTIFLETSTCLFSPYHVHTAQVLKGVTLVLLSEAPKHSIADCLYQIMHNIQDLIQGRRSKLPRSRSLHVYEIVNSLLVKLHGALRKAKGKEGSLIQEIHARWEKEDMKIRFLEYLEKDIHCPIPPELESPLWEMYKKLRALFSLLFLHPPPENLQLKETLLQLSDRFSAELVDYKDYLNVKAERNITMTSYIEDFPGLIHFIFIDRRLHQITAPSLNVTHFQGENNDATAYIKTHIWRMYQHMMKKLMEGYTTVLMKDGDFYFSYFLWFEDSKRNPLPVQELFKPSNKLPYPGILCGSFYKDIIHQCFPHTLHSSVYCYEMFLMHLGTVHPQYIASHWTKLAHKMWEMSGDAYSPLNLL